MSFLGYDVFLSYKREELEVARKVYKALRQNGVEVWFDEKIQCGQEWHGEIDLMLETVPCIVVLWSEQSAQSPWVHHEASCSIARNVYAPCQIDANQIPVPFDKRQAAKLIRWDGDDLNYPGFVKLLDRVRELAPYGLFGRLYRFIKRHLSLAIAVFALIVSLVFLVVISNEVSKLNGLTSDNGFLVKTVADTAKDIRSSVYLTEKFTKQNYRATAFQQPNYLRLRYLVRLWEQVVVWTKDPDNEYPTKIKGIEIFKKIPKTDQDAIENSVRQLRRLIDQAEDPDGDINILFCLVEYSMRALDIATSNEYGGFRGSPPDIETIDSLYGPTSGSEALKMAKLTIEKTLEFYKVYDMDWRNTGSDAALNRFELYIFDFWELDHLDRLLRRNQVKQKNGLRGHSSNAWSPICALNPDTTMPHCNSMYGDGVPSPESTRW